METGKKIKTVYYRTWEDTAIVLEICLPSGAVVFYPVLCKEDDPLFQALFTGAFQGQPKTDGARVYWDNGAQIGWDEIRAALETGLQPGKITHAEAAEEHLDEIEIRLENGITLLLPLRSRMEEPLFAQIRELSLPKTDGEQVYWVNHASLTAQELLAMLMGNETDESLGK